jgi:ribose 1,5-bisphosphokinase
LFPKRIVTREASPSEDNQELDRASFRKALARGDFAVHWEAHDLCYALPRCIDDEIRAGCTVVVNVSRTVVEGMRSTYADVVVIEITAPPQVLAERLAMRARSSDGAVELRLRRNVDAARPDITIVNVGGAEGHAQQLVGAIKGEPLNR